MADSTESSSVNEGVPSYGRVPVFVSRGNRGCRYHARRPAGQQAENSVIPPGTSNTVNSQTLPQNRNDGSSQNRRGGNPRKNRSEFRQQEANTPHEKPVKSIDPNAESSSISERGNNRPMRRGRGSRFGNRGEYHSRPTTSAVPREQALQNAPSLNHSFNPNAAPYYPSSNQVRLQNVVDLPNGGPANVNISRNKGNNRGSRKEFSNRPNQGFTSKRETNTTSKIKNSKALSNKPRSTKREENPNAPLRERLKNSLEDNDYECMICCQPITSKQGIWSCKKCYNMFHISGGCIVNWARKSRQDDTNDQWRCPTCQTKYSQIPYNYYCFCGKDRNPTPQIGETPHSCGQVCGGERGPGCPHPCTEPCHPGPCAECPVMVTQNCNCGKMEKTTRCGAGLQISCDQVCNRLLSCGNHTCTKVCHSGQCSPCDVRVTQKCYCQHEDKEVPCNTGSSYEYSCRRPCSGKYDCGIHNCINKCHPTDKDCGPCILAPERITHCPCGKYTLAEMNAKGVRTTCSAPVAVCESICNKVLPCGKEGTPHRCRSKCHIGLCPPCELNSSITCRCKQVTKTVPCKDYCDIIAKGEYLCERRCKKKKTCGIHRCQEVCCVQDVHICMQMCNKRLPCGLHNCESLCHPGECMRCLRASFEEQFCHCGRTMRPPPIACGTPLPECDEPCARPHPCNHNVNHKCHPLNVCPPCTVLVERECYGKHEVRRNIPCHIEGVSCGRECGRELPCGVHMCNRRCHFGDCLKPGESCGQPCSIIRTNCEHPCNVKCHGMSDCPNSPCDFSTTALCECGRRKESMRCHEIERIKHRLRALAVEDEAEMAEGVKSTLKRTRSTENLPVLSCNDDCKKVARNKKLADALSIVTNDDGDTDSPMITFSETMKNGLKSYPHLVLEVEKVFLKMLEALADQTLQSSVLSYHFAPMQLEKRRLIHEYAPYFHLESVSVDEVPKRNVIVTGRRGIARPPLILLSDLQKYPSVLKYTGSTTLRHNINDEIKKAAAAEEDESGMKQIKANKTVYKRMPPKIVNAEPIKQANLFAILGSDDEEDIPAKPKNHMPDTHEVRPSDEPDVDWWSDDTEKNSNAEKIEQPVDPEEKEIDVKNELQNLCIQENNENM